MTEVRVGGESVRKFLIENIDAHPASIVKLAGERFGCTRQAIHKHLKRLADEGALAVSGNTRSKRYSLAPLLEWKREYPVSRELAELQHNHTARTTKKVFDKFSSGDDYGFNTTVVPVKLMRYGDDNLVSQSQAKRLLARVDRFKLVMLDFSGVASIGQAFADEVFRVFRSKHPQVQLEPIHTSSEVRRMISRAGALAAESGSG